MHSRDDAVAVSFPVHDLKAGLEGLDVLAVSRSTTDEDAMAAMRPLAVFNQCLLGLTRFHGETPWECHPDGDELLHVLEGAVEVTVLTDGGPVERTVSAGSAFVVPRGLWHRQNARRPAALFFATAAETTASSWAEDPRRES
jgi:mannose-6-phosphate isomerase-like protein (cupin superfamily)